MEFSDCHDHPQGGPGIAAGCACVLKPAEQTPLSALALADWQNAPAFRQV